MAEANYKQAGDQVDYTPVAAILGGTVVQLADGRAGVVKVDLEAGQKGAAAVHGIYKVTKTAGIVLLDGGKLFWDHSANAATFKQVSDRDFYLGTVQGDAASADTTVFVALNERQRCVFDAAYDPCTTVIVGAATITRRGGTHKFNLVSTNEAEKVDLIAKTHHWITYDLPPELLGKVWNGKYRGQRQKWFLFRFTGQDSDIDIATAHPEFSRWKWVTADEMVDAIVPFKREVYEQVVDAFRAYLS